MKGYLQQPQETCLIDEHSDNSIRPGSISNVFAGGAQQYDAASSAALPQTFGSHQANLPLAQQMLQDIPVQLSNGCWDGYDGYTFNFLPHARLIAERHLALFYGFSGRGAKYIPDAARQPTSFSLWQATHPGLQIVQTQGREYA